VEGKLAELSLPTPARQQLQELRAGPGIGGPDQQASFLPRGSLDADVNRGICKRGFEKAFINNLPDLLELV
jgi:hypothetical protein